MSSYCVITPAFNEEKSLGQVIETLVTQSVLPKKWLIVDDGSTDQTASIIKKYAEQYPFIQYIFREKPKGQDYFASNVFAIMEGYRQIRDESFDFLGVLDADILLPKDYYHAIIRKFGKDKQLGVASGIYENLINGKLHKVLNDRRSTPKAIQVFRKEVFDELNGYLPMKYGGEDTVSCFMARMNGWKVWSFPDIKVVHLRPTGTGAANSIFQARFKQGVAEYHMATQPLFFALKCLRRMVLERPYFLGGLLRGAGYCWTALRREPRQLPKDVITFLRKEQLRRVFSGNKCC